MSNGATERFIPEFAISDFAPIDTTTLPKGSPPEKLESAEIVNFEIAERTYRIEKFTEAITRDPKSAFAWYNRGRAYIDAKNYDQAIEDFNKAISLDHNLHFYIGRSAAYYYQHRDEDALIELDEIISRFDDAPKPALLGQVAKALLCKGITLAALSRHEQAIAVYDDLFNRLRDASKPVLRELVAATLLYKGLTLFQMGVEQSDNDLHEQAIAVCDDMLNRFRDASEPLLRGLIAKTLLNKADVLTELRRQEQAIATYDDLLNQFEDASEELELREAVAKALLTKAVRLAQLGHDELRRGSFTKGCDYFREAIQCKENAKLLVKIHIEDYLLKYYGLSQEEEKTSSNGYDLPTRVITEAELREYIKEQADLLTERLSQPEEPPFPILSERTVKAIVAHGKKHQWDDRKERGWPYHTNAFVYVHITYRKWVNRGLTREILAWADPPLHAHLNKKISREDLPEWLDLPTGAEARARAITDPTERAELEITRKVLRERTRKHRASLGD